jgi:hypothetical protein
MQTALKEAKNLSLSLRRGLNIHLAISHSIYANKENRNKRCNTPKIDNFASENMENFNYLGYILNADNIMNIVTAERIAKGKKPNYVNANLIKSKFLNKYTKIKIYRTMIRSVVTY